MITSLSLASHTFVMISRTVVLPLLRAFFSFNPLFLIIMIATASLKVSYYCGAGEIDIGKGEECTFK